MDGVATSRRAAGRQFEFDDLHSAPPAGRPGDEQGTERPGRTVGTNLPRVQRELCLIKLCWPDVPDAIAEDLYARSLPDGYRRVGDKERLLLWYAENFRRQIHAKHANRRPLLLACENECRVQVGTDSKGACVPRLIIKTAAVRKIESWKSTAVRSRMITRIAKLFPFFFQIIARDRRDRAIPVGENERALIES